MIVLFAWFTSVSAPETMAWSVSVASPPGAVTLIVTVALVPAARPPIEQTTVVPVCTQPVLAETNTTVAGSESVTDTPVAAAGPLFVAVRVYVSGPGATSVPGDPLPVSARSVEPAGPAVVVIEVELFALTGSGWVAVTFVVFV